MSTKPNKPSITEYFASLQDPVQLADQIKIKIDEWRQYCTSKNLIQLWTKKLNNYYGASANGNSSQTIGSGGSQGELSLIKVNDFHQLLQQQLITVTSQRPAGQVQAINSDTTSLKQAKIASSLCEFYMNNGLEAKFVSAVEMALIVDEAYVELFWDKSAGDPVAVDPDTEESEMSGDVIMRTHAPWNTARDTGLNLDQQKWVIVSYKLNKFDASITYPKFAESILNTTNDSHEIDLNYIPEGSDAIFAHLLIHDRTSSVPNGRYSLMIGDQIVLDTVLPYKDFPVERISPSDVIDSNLGYSPSNDVIGLEQATDALYSGVLTNNINNSVQSIIAPEGIDINPSDLIKGMRFFQVPSDQVDKIKALQLTKSAPETYQLIQTLSNKKESATGSVASTLQSQAQQGASGSAMALIQAQSISFNSGIQRSYFRLLSATMTKLISVLRTYADVPRVAKLVGKVNSVGLKEFKFTGDDLASVSTITYQMVNPLSQTIGGRLSLGQDLIKAGMIKSPKEYISVVSTGQIETLTQDDEADQMLILEENEALTEGQDVQVVATEMHADHLKSHMSIISSVTAKSDPQLVARVLQHIQSHLDTWGQLSQNNPGLLFATGQQPMPQPQPQAQPGMPPGMAPPSAPQGPQKIIGSGQAPVEHKASEISPAIMPTNPLTKQPASVPGAA